ncbi:MAG: hypothetical protein HZA32_07060 [Opitutae bacterium]|nr:hypothetical protein [Opitutae bacterium]
MLIATAILLALVILVATDTGDDTAPPSDDDTVRTGADRGPLPPAHEIPLSALNRFLRVLHILPFHRLQSCPDRP